MGQINWVEYPEKLLDLLKEVDGQSPRSPLRTILENATASVEALEYDRWNGGTTYYAFNLLVPVTVYASVELSIEEIESKIHEKISRLLRGETNDFVSKVYVQPRHKEHPQPQLSVPPDFWLPGHFRLFISHLGEHKESAQRLAKTLRAYGITSFVAHEDIEPTKEWQLEIHRALFSMDALAAILSRGLVEATGPITKSASRLVAKSLYYR